MRRTLEEKNLIAEKLEVVINKCNLYKISPYEIGQNTNVSLSGARKLLGGITKNPSLDTLKIIEEYIDKKEASLSLEKAENYFKSLSTNQKIDHIYKKVDDIELLLHSFDTKQKIMFEILKDAKTEELKFFETAIKERLSSSNKPA